MNSSPTSPVIMFDFDGVIADSLDVYFEVFSEVCTEMGYDRINSKEVFLRFLEGNPIRQLLWAGFPLFRLKQLAEKFRPRVEQANSRIGPFPGLPEMVGQIAERFPVYIVTSNIKLVIEGFAAQHGIEGLRGIIGADEETSKVKKIRRVMRLHPGCPAYYIGDTKGDMIEARRAGAIPVAAGWGYHTVEKLREGRPEHVVETPEALFKLLVASC